MEILKNKVAVITGSASGVGQATCLLFAQKGATIIGIDDHPNDQTATLLQQQKYDGHFFTRDVGDAAQVETLTEECKKLTEKVDILFNNAGRSIKQSFEETTPDTWEKMIGTNLTSIYLCSKNFLPLMKKAGSGAIINHASIDAILGNPKIAAYTAAKGALIPLTHVMAHDLAKHKIRVNCISSGGIMTGMTAWLKGAPQSIVESTPLQRMGRADEVAQVALFLASDMSSFVNGTNIVVDGGRTGITQGTYQL